MDGTDSRTGEQRPGSFVNQRQIDRNAIAFSYSQLPENVAKLLHLSVQISVGQSAAVTRLSFPDQSGLVCPTPGDMSVDTIRGDVEFATKEPLRMGWLPFENFVPLL